MRRLAARLRAARPSWTTFPTRRFAGALAVAAAFWLIPGATGTWLAVASIGALIAVAAYDFARLPGREAFQVARHVANPMGLGDANTIRYEIDSASPQVVHVQLYDSTPAGIAASMHGTAFTVGGGRGYSLAIPAVGQTRGTQRFGDLALRVVSRIGLFARIVRLPLHDQTVVVPSLSNVRRLRLLAMHHHLGEAGVRALRQRGEGTSFTGLREYVPGDDPRLLDWKATARHARLITREQAIERSQTVISMIDCGRAMTQLAGRFSRFEHVLSAALVLSDVASSSGDRVGMIAFDDDVRRYVAPQKGLAALRGLRTSMSGLDATLTEPDYASAFRLLAVRQRRRALVVFFTDVVDVRAAKSFLAYATRASQRHMLVVVAIQNETLVAAARPSSRGNAALFRSAAAEELVREREEALARMRQAGIAVLDVPAAGMAASVVNRYLEIKARGLL